MPHHSPLFPNTQSAFRPPRPSNFQTLAFITAWLPADEIWEHQRHLWPLADSNPDRKALATGRTQAKGFFPNRAPKFPDLLPTLYISTSTRKGFQPKGNFSRPVKSPYWPHQGPRNRPPEVPLKSDLFPPPVTEFQPQQVIWWSAQINFQVPGNCCVPSGPVPRDTPR